MEIRESKVEKEAVNYAKAMGWWVSKFTSPGKRGVPDRVFIKAGIVVFMEFKRPGEKLTAQQSLRRKEMRKHGAIVVWADTTLNAKDWLDFLS